MSTFKYKLSLSAEDPPKDLVAFFSGVGMIRGEYLLRKNQMYITKPDMQCVTEAYIEQTTQLFAPHDVWYRTIELPVNAINQLDGVDFVLHEDDIFAGTRGIRRSLRYPETFKIELDIVSRLSQKYGNLHILLPFVHDVKELDMAKRILAKVGYNNKIGVMAEIPSTILCFEAFCQRGIDNITVGLNDLTEFTLASARDSATYNRAHPAVVRLLAEVVEIGRKHGIETVLAGDISREMNDIGKRLGFDAISVFVKDIPNILQDLPKESDHGSNE